MNEVLGSIDSRVADPLLECVRACAPVSFRKHKNKSRKVCMSRTSVEVDAGVDG